MTLILIHPGATMRRAFAAAALPLLVCSAVGCSGDAGVLARVRQQAITIEQFNEVAQGNLQQYAGSPDSVKDQLLRDLVDRELLVQGAMGERMDQTPEFQAHRGRIEQQILREALFQRLMGGPFPVSDAEVREIYTRRDTATRVRLIFAYDESTIRGAARDLARGETFEVIADRYNPTGMLPPGGDIGFVQPGTMVPALDEILRTGMPGRIAGPIQAGTDGWFIARVEERRPESQPPFEEVRGQLTEMLRQRKQRVVATRAVERIRLDYQVEVLPGAPQAMAERLRPTAEDIAARRPRSPDPADRSLPLARYQGGTFTLGDAHDDLLANAGGRIDFAMLPTVRRWIESQTIERTAILEARRRRLDEEPDVQRRLRGRVNNFLLDGYYQRQVIARAEVAPGAVRATYEQYRDGFVSLHAAHVVSVTLEDSASAATLAAQGAKAPSLREAAANAAVAGRVVEERLVFPSGEPAWASFEPQIMTMRPGETSGPYQTASGWFVFQLIDKRQSAPPFESLGRQALARVQGIALEVAREDRLRALTDSLRQALSPVVYSERLRRIPWPPSASPAGT